MLDLDGHTHPVDSRPASGDLEAMLLAPVPARTVIPRRPLRLTPLREDVATDPRANLAALNIFADIFDPEPVADSDVSLDPRIAASRRRARNRIDRHVNSLAPDEANFWHASTWSAPQDAATPTQSAAVPANDSPDLPSPLHEQLARVREALYSQGSDDEAQVLETPSVQIRLASHAMTATLVVVAFPLGAALTTYSLFRGANIRLSAQAMAVVASALGLWHSVPFTHLL